MNSLRTRVSTRVSTLDARRRHRALARAILRLLPEPESWLDVGTGDAHFPETAKTLFPYTSFDGLDPTPESSAPAPPNASRRPTPATSRTRTSPRPSSPATTS